MLESRFKNESSRSKVIIDRESRLSYDPMSGNAVYKVAILLTVATVDSCIHLMDVRTTRVLNTQHYDDGDNDMQATWVSAADYRLPSAIVMRIPTRRAMSGVLTCIIERRPTNHSIWFANSHVLSYIDHPGRRATSHAALWSDYIPADEHRLDNVIESCKLLRSSRARLCICILQSISIEAHRLSIKLSSIIT